MRKRRQETKEKLLGLTLEGQKEFKRHAHRHSENWKQFVARYVNERLRKGNDDDAIIAKALTRWVNAGLIADIPLTEQA